MTLGLLIFPYSRGKKRKDPAYARTLKCWCMQRMIQLSHVCCFLSRIILTRPFFLRVFRYPRFQCYLRSRSPMLFLDWNKRFWRKSITQPVVVAYLGCTWPDIELISVIAHRLHRLRGIMCKSPTYPDHHKIFLSLWICSPSEVIMLMMINYARRVY